MSEVFESLRPLQKQSVTFFFVERLQLNVIKYFVISIKDLRVKKDNVGAYHNKDNCVLIDDSIEKDLC